MANLKILASTDSDIGAKSLTDSETGRAFTELADEELKRQFSRALASVTSIFEEDASKEKSLSIKEITLKFEITTKGEVRLIAAAGVEAKGAIEVKLARS
ncbi:hypothetical protein ABIB75_007673 [Bradyrhizobium sp. GM2.2]|uniref:Pepco domain-containing protein n=1 Tax=Bradyrhizobium sp. GM2.2 TaxID=3156358 RepID=UPI0033983250